METFIEEDLLPEDSDISELVDHLVKGADGMFLWARLMINYLSSPALTPFQRIKTILRVIMPEGLDNMYRRISDLIVKHGRTQLDLASRILTWAAFATEPITVEELHDVLTYKDSSEKGHQFKDFQETISVICGGLVECYRPWNSLTESQELIIRCIYLSVKEHFSLSLSTDLHEQVTGLCLPAEPLAHIELLESCLGYMCYYQPPGRTGSSNPGAKEADDFAKYASHRWPSHLCKAFSAKSLEFRPKIPQFNKTARMILERMIDFLEDPKAVKSWIEMYYSQIRSDDHDGPDTYSLSYNLYWITFPELHEASYSWSLLLRTLQKLLQDWTSDVNRLVTEWGARLTENPSIIWDEVPSFINSKFIGFSSSAAITPLGPTTLERHNCSSRPLCTVSKTASNGQTTSILTVWPSKTYEQCWEDHSTPFHVLNHPPAYQNWIARYEVWQHENKKMKVIDAMIPLCPEEISTLLRQAYRLKDGGAWGLSFPLAISNDLFSVVILRTMYECYIDKKGVLEPIKSAIIPMDFFPDLKIRWSRNFNQLPQDWYSYKFSFSPDNQCLLFWDSIHHGGTTLLKGLESQQANVMTVFKILRSPSLSVELVNNVALKGKGIIRNAIFHPYHQFVTLDFGFNVEAWQFMNRKQPITRR